MAQVDESLLNRLVMPGDELLRLADQGNQQELSADSLDKAYNVVDDMFLGPGLRLTADYRIVATQPGVLRHRVPACYWVEAAGRRYVAARGEAVLGVVLRRQGDVYRVDIGAAETAILSYLSFENATKRNRPDVQIGDVVYGRLAVADPDLEPELVCVDSTGRSVGYGVLPRDACGLLLPCGIQLSRRLLQNKKSKVRCLFILTLCPFCNSHILCANVGQSATPTI